MKSNHCFSLPESSELDLNATQKLLHHSTIRVPYEVLNKTYRNVQKQLDKDITAVSKSSDDLLTATTTEEVTSILTGVLDKLSKLKRKASEGVGEELSCLKATRRRLDHLRSSESRGETAFQEQQRTVGLLVEYFLRHGCYGSAERLAAQHEVAGVTNLPYLSACRQVEAALRAQDTGPAVAWCADNRSKLRKLGSSLEFLLRLQEFVQLVKAGRRLEAVRHARAHLSCTDGVPERCRALREAMTLLALPPHSQQEPYCRLTEPQSWERLVQRFREVNCAVFSVNSCSVFSAAFQVGLASMKTNQCGKENRRSVDCPVCQPLMEPLAQIVPKAQFTQSQLICPITGRRMTDDNPPLALPNGNIYSRQALEEMADRNGGLVTCPRSNDTFTLKDAKKLFIM